jgi:hypothetical protein
MAASLLRYRRLLETGFQELNLTLSRTMAEGWDARNGP